MLLVLFLLLAVVYGQTLAYPFISDLALLLVLGLYELLLGRPNSLLRLLPYGILVCCYLALKIALFSALTSDDQNAFYGIDFLPRLYTMSLAFLVYMEFCLWPFQLGCAHQLNDFPLLTSWSDPRLWLGSASVALFFFCWGIAWYYHKKVAFWLGWFFLFLLPVSNIIPTGVVMGERFLTLLLLAFVLGISLGLSRLKHYRWLLLSVFVLGYGFLSFHRTGFCQDEVTYWRRVLAVSPNDYLARMRMGNIHYAKGDLPVALRYFEEACGKRSYRPYTPMYPRDCGRIYLQLGQTERAFVSFHLAESRIEQYRLPREHFLEVYHALGYLYFTKGDWKNTQACLTTVVRFSDVAPFDMLQKSCHWLAVSYIHTRDYAKAAAVYQELLQRDPNFATAHYNLAILYLLHFHDKDKAQVHWDKAKDLHFPLPQAALKLWQESAERNR